MAAVPDGDNVEEEEGQKDARLPAGEEAKGRTVGGGHSLTTGFPLELAEESQLYQDGSAGCKGGGITSLIVAVSDKQKTLLRYKEYKTQESKKEEGLRLDKAVDVAVDVLLSMAESHESSQ